MEFLEPKAKHEKLPNISSDPVSLTFNLNPTLTLTSIMPGETKREAGDAVKDIGIVGFPFSKGQPRAGTEHGPGYLRRESEKCKGGVKENLEALGHTVHDHGDVIGVDEEVKPDEPLVLEVKGKNCGSQRLLKNPRNCGWANKKLSAGVERVLRLNQSALVLGGDHSMAIGSIHGHAQYERPVVVWVDAHADINTPLTSDSGNIHGMPLSFLVRELRNDLPKVPGFEWCEPCLDIKDIVYIGLRDVDGPERKIMTDHNMKSYSMQEVDHLTISKVMEKALKDVDPTGTRPIHLSFDVDAMDPDHTPATGTPVPGGLTLRETFYIAEAVAKTGRLSVLDVAEVNASDSLFTASQRERTVKTTLNVITKFYGSKREGNLPPHYTLPEC